MTNRTYVCGIGHPRSGALLTIFLLLTLAPAAGPALAGEEGW